MKVWPTTYRIIDEPSPGPLEDYIVNTFWPLLAGMLGGLWLGLPWFLFNSSAMGSATKKKELHWALAGLAAVIAGAAFTVTIVDAWAKNGTVDPIVLRFCILGIQLLKLATYYKLHALQSRSFSLHEYYGGHVRNGAMVAVAGALLRIKLIDLVGHPFFILVIS